MSNNISKFREIICGSVVFRSSFLFRYYNQEKKSQRTNTKTSTLYMKYLGNKVLVHHRYSQKRPRNYKPYFA
ncbi:unnamed protein product [Schistosoma haematobium]|nr:unnamed protein product [Schistosoma haematobium]